ncbi:gp436 family protein [Histophilus somni]|uniref:gp436 family protein n=1 Tax=Histophilus somni TaxID=731 RepID=UPI00109D7DC5|nr:DUF1320 domain-containing protein [Histophilus somni]QEH19132.1 DUF1320 domain-containing protein [Histophilus somni]THA47065.1 DUF1320 domain-containing protein [Histophilus somni]
MYATIKDFVARVGESETIELTDREAVGEINSTVLETALSDSTSQIDGYLSGRYKLPLVIVPQNLVRICCDLARYRLAGVSHMPITEEIETRYKLCIKELESLSKGVVSLGVEELNSSRGNEDNTVQFFNTGNRIFERNRR